MLYFRCHSRKWKVEVLFFRPEICKLQLMAKSSSPHVFVSSLLEASQACWFIIVDGYVQAINLLSSTKADLNSCDRNRTAHKA